MLQRSLYTMALAGTLLACGAAPSNGGDNTAPAPVAEQPTEAQKPAPEPAPPRTQPDYSHLSPEVRERVERRAKLSSEMLRDAAARSRAKGLKVIC